jgi:glycosyltransferase involved in cell wall biosynthesis
MPSGSGERRGPAGEPLTSDAEAAAARTRHALAALDAADRLIVPSPAARAVFERSGVSAAQLAVIEYGIDAAAIARQVEVERARRSRPRGALVLGFLGSVLPSKGPLELARAVLAAGIGGLCLEIHGPEPSWHGDTSYTAALRALAAADGRVALLGAYPQSDLARVLARLDAVAVPSLWEETYGLVAREARAAGLPVLVSDRGGLPAAAVGAAAGSAVLPAGDPAAWIAALRRLAGSVRGGSAPATAASARGLRTLEEMVGEIEALYLATSRAPVGARGSEGARERAPAPAAVRAGRWALDDRGEGVESPAS